MKSKVKIEEVGRYEKLRHDTYMELKKLNPKLLEILEDNGFDRYSFPFVIREKVVNG